MGCFGDNSPAARKDREIQKQLKQDFKQQNSIIKLLLLGLYLYRKLISKGTGGSGKSTIFKQMKIIHKNGYSKEERMRFKDVIYDNILTSIRALIGGMEQLGITFEKNDSKEIADKIMAIPQEQITLRPGSILTPQLGQAIKSLWQDKGIQDAFEKSSAFQLHDSASYYLNAIDRIATTDYIPTVDDVLHSRVKTVGIVESQFSVDKLNFKLVDVGGQRNERRKWIHVFDEVTAIIFVTAISEYDKVLEEDESMNRMRESILLFDEICNCRYFRETSIIIFFNKKDLFETKIKKVPLTTCFPDYTGGNNYDAALEYIKKRFLEVNKHTRRRQIYTHATCATDTTNIRTVFNIVKNIFMHDNIRDLNLA